MNLFTYRNVIRVFLINLITLIFVQILFFFLQSIQSESASTSIKTILRQEITSSNLFLISRSLQDLDDAKLIRCVTLRKEGSGALYLDLTFKGDCASPSFYLNGKSVINKFESLNGDIWLIEFISVNGHFFTLSLWLLRFILCFSFSMIYFWHIQKVQQERFIADLEQQQKLLIENLAAQVIHDVASPLSALNIVIENSALPTQVREILKIAYSRTESILHDLKNQTKYLSLNPIEKTDVTQILNLIIQEKQTLFSKIYFVQKNINCHAKANPKELARIFSNIINNAIEAGVNNPNHEIRINIEENEIIKINVQDNGVGIPLQNLSSLGKRGVTFNKSSGSGLGLFHAKSSLESWGGSLHIESKINQGTTVSITLQKFPVRLLTET